MRRNIAILFLSWATALTAASCGSASDTATAPSTTVAAGKSTTTAKPANALDPKKCQAIEGYLLAYKIAARPESKDAANQEKVIKGLTNTSATLTKAMPLVKPEVETITAYATKLVKADAGAAAEKDAADKAEKKLNGYRSTCPKEAAGGGATPSTAKTPAKTPTTTEG